MKPRVTKTFTITGGPPTGNDIADLVTEYRLGDHEVQVERLMNELSNSMVWPSSKYRWEVRFIKEEV